MSLDKNQPAANQGFAAYQLSDIDFLRVAARALLSLVLLPPSLCSAPSASSDQKPLQSKADYTMQDPTESSPVKPKQASSQQQTGEASLVPAPMIVNDLMSVHVEADPNSLNFRTSVKLPNDAQSRFVRLSEPDGSLSNRSLQLSAPCTAPSLTLDAQCTDRIRDFVTIPSTSEDNLKVSLKSSLRSESQALPRLDWLLGPKSAKLERQEDKRPLDTVSLNEAYDRILAKLILLESREPNEHYKTDFRLAWHIVRICQTGEAKLCTPAVLAWFQVCNCHPTHVWPRLVAARKAKLGKEYSLWYGPDDVLLPDRVIPDFDPLLAYAKHRTRPAGAGEAPIVAPNKRSAPVPSQPKKGIA